LVINNTKHLFLSGAVAMVTQSQSTQGWLN